MSRWYCPQVCHWQRGWVDLPTLASRKEHDAIKKLDAFLEVYKLREHRIPPSGRVHRKPHGWKPTKADIPADMLQGIVQAENAHLPGHQTGPEEDVHKIVYFDGPEAVGVCLQAIWPRGKFAYKWVDVTCGHCLIGRLAGEIPDMRPPNEYNPVIGLGVKWSG